MASDLSKIFSKLHGKIFSMFFSRSLIQVNTVLNMQRMKKGTTLLKKLLEDTFHQIKKRKGTHCSGNGHPIHDSGKGKSYYNKLCTRLRNQLV